MRLTTYYYENIYMNKMNLTQFVRGALERILKLGRIYPLAN